MSRPPIADLLPLVPPPVVYATCFLLGLLLDGMLPWSPGWMREPWLHLAGWVGVLAALAWGLSCIALFLLRRTTPLPHGEPSHLVTDGPFRLSRNPMYLALATVYGALAVLLARPWPLLLLPFALGFMDRVIIPWEERRLAASFGGAYDAYCRRVRRWL